MNEVTPDLCFNINHFYLVYVFSHSAECIVSHMYRSAVVDFCSYCHSSPGFDLFLAA